jgi:hypothetical protein
MNLLTSTLLTDGTSDRVLIPILTLLMSELSDRPIAEMAMATPTVPTGQPLSQRIQRACDLFPCELLFVHRDAENQASHVREVQIREAAGLHPNPFLNRSLICVIPVRMTEAWLLTEESAIRQSVGNPNGKAKLSLPTLRRLEYLPDPKAELFQIMRQALNLNSRRLQKFSPDQHRHKIGEALTDLAGLRQLPSFQAVEKQLQDHFSDQR